MADEIQAALVLAEDSRTLTSATFSTADPKRKVVVASLVVNSVPADVDAFLTGIPHQSTAVDMSFIDKGGKLDLANAWYSIAVDEANIAFSATWIDGSQAVIRLLMTPASGMLREYVANSIWLREVAPGLDIECRCQPHAFEIFKWVKNEKSPHVLNWDYRWKAVKLAITPDPSGEIAWDSSQGMGRRLLLQLDVSDVDVDKDGYSHRTLNETVSPRAINVRFEPEKGFDQPATYPLIIDTTFGPVAIGFDADDGFERTSTTSWFNSSYGKFVGNTTVYNVGLRWRNITVPQGATINSASINWNVTSISSTPAATIFGDNVDNAVGWDATHRPSQMSNTVASSGPTTITTGSFSMDVKTVVQEIVNRAGWASGNAMRFGVFTSVAGNFYATDFAAGAGTFANLTIDYTAGGGATRGLFLPNSLSGLGAGGSFFQDRLQ